MIEADSPGKELLGKLEEKEDEEEELATEQRRKYTDLE